MSARATPTAPFKSIPIRSRLSPEEQKEMNNYGEVWKVKLNNMGQHGNISIGNLPVTEEEIKQKRINNSLVWARRPRTRRATGTRGGRRRALRRRTVRRR